MSPTLARRLGACAKNITKYQHARLSTKSSEKQSPADEHNKEHLERLTLLQAEDRRLLKPVQAKIEEYQAVLDKTREFLTTLSPALQPIQALESPAHTLIEHRHSITEALAALDRLKDAKLPNLLAQVEDLQIEEYPQPGSDESEIDFLERVSGMTTHEKKDVLDSLDMEIRAYFMQSTESIQRLTGRYQEPSAIEEAPPEEPLERKENRFAKEAAKAAAAAAAAEASKKKAEEQSKGKFGLSTEEQFANVIADAQPRDRVPRNKVEDKSNFGLGQNSGEATTWKPVESSQPTYKKPEPKPRSPKPSVEKPSGSAWGASNFLPRQETRAPKPKPQGHDLNSLQAQLEASWKKSAKS